MIHIYCGDGKGKTTAAIGLAARMAGNGGRVHIAQFLKGSESGEISFLKNVVKNNAEITVSRLDRDYGFYKNMTESEKAEITNCHNAVLQDALSMLDSLDMLVLDEIFAALNYGLADMGTVKRIMEGCGETELVLTGREPGKYFLGAADYISEIKKIKHPFDMGVKARKGIEF